MAVSKITTTDFTELITPVHRKLFTQEYYAKPQKQYEKFCKVIDMAKASETFVHMGGFGLPQSNSEGSTINQTTMSAGDTATLTSQRYDMGYEITHEMRNQDLYDVWGGAGKMGDTIVNDAPQKIAKSFINREELSAAGIFTGGFADTGYDGYATFYASHPLADSDSTASNLVSGALTPATLKDAITLMRSNNVDEANLVNVIIPKLLLIPYGLEFKAAEILGSEKQAYEFANTKNVIGGIDYFVSDYIARTGDTNAATNWFLISHDVENAVFGKLEDTWFDAHKLQMTANDVFAFGYTHFGVGIVNWRGLVGSTGA